MATTTQAAATQKAQKQANNQAWIINKFVLANIPGLDPTQTPPDTETIPSQADIVHEEPVFQEGYVNPNLVVYSLFLDATIGNFTFNWIGLVDEDDELIMVEYVNPRTKTKTENGIIGDNLTHNMFLAFTNAQAITDIQVEAQSWQLQFDNQLRVMDERERLENFRKYGDLTTYGGGLTIIHNDTNQEVTISSGVCYAKGLPISQPQAVVIASAPASGIVYLDAYFELMNDSRIVIHEFRIDGNSTDYVDPQGRQRYVVSLGDYNAGSSNDSVRFNVSQGALVNEFQAQINTINSNIQAIASNISTIDGSLQSVLADTAAIKSTFDVVDNLGNGDDFVQAVRNVPFNYYVPNQLILSPTVELWDFSTQRIQSQQGVTFFECILPNANTRSTINIAFGNNTNPNAGRILRTDGTTESPRPGQILANVPTLIYIRGNEWIIFQGQRAGRYLPITSGFNNPTIVLPEPGRLYDIRVTGQLQNRGPGVTDMVGAEIFDSNDDTILSQVDLSFNWPGEFGWVSHFFILAPDDGFVRAEVDDQDALHIFATPLSNYL